MAISKILFGTHCGEDVYEFTLSRGDIAVSILTYGGIIRKFIVKTAAGERDIVLGYDTLKEYEKDGGTYFGAIIGRVANRIANGVFTLNGKRYELYKNNGSNCLHGGKCGFNAKVWKSRVIGDYSLELSYFSADGEENFPGNLQVKAVYSLTERKGLKIEYFAKSDADTPINLTNHAYFNLNGEGTGDVLGHKLALFADKITPVNEKLVPMGKYMPVIGTPFDFSTAKTIGKDINAENEQLAICSGYDVNFVKANARDPLIAEATGDKSGITMQVYTTEQGVQFYSGNFLNGVKGKSGVYAHRNGFCLETQKFPNAVNCKEYPSPVLKAGEEYKSTTEYVIL